MTNYFENVSSFDELRKTYKMLILEFHPDRNQDRDTTRIMQDINAEYDRLAAYLASPQGWNTEAQNDKEWTEGRQNFHIDLSEQLKQVLFKLLSVEGVSEVEITGYWFWCHGVEKGDKETIQQLRDIGCRWARKKKLWYFAGVKSNSRTSTPMAKIRENYGSQTVGKANKDDKQLAA